MGFFGLFRSKEEKLAWAIAELYRDVVLATFKSTIAIERILDEKLETTLESSARYNLCCEIFCFYSHIVDYLLLGKLGEHRALLVRAQLVPFGVERLVQSSLSEAGDEVWDPNITDPATLLKRSLISSSKVMDLVELNIVRNTEYFECQDVFVSDVTEAYQRGDAPGITDALSDEPDSKVSRLVQNAYETLQASILELGLDLKILRKGLDAPRGHAETMGFVEICRTIHISVYEEIFNDIKLPEKLQKLGRLIR